MMSADTLYWFFSTIAQTFAALIGLVAVVCIYRLQGLDNSRWRVMENTIEARSYQFKAPNAYKQTPQEFVRKWRKLKANYTNVNLIRYGATLDGAEHRIVELFGVQRKIRRWFIFFLIDCLSIMLLSIGSLLVVTKFKGDRIDYWVVGSLMFCVIIGMVTTARLTVLLIPSVIVDKIYPWDTDVGVLIRDIVKKCI